MRLAACTALLAVACNQPASRIEIEPLAEGEWIVVHAGADRPVLRQTRARREGRRGQTPEPPQLAVLDDTLHAVTADTSSIRPGNARIALLHVRDADVYVTATGHPQLLRSPTDPRRYTFEHDDAIWLFEPPDQIRKLTRDDDMQTLRGRQREGVAILYWSAHPVWSADGTLISFLSNREAFRAGEPGQSLWTIDIRSGEQQPLFNDRRVSVHTEGVLGEEFIFVSNTQPGVLSIHPRTKRVTHRGAGYVGGGHPGGKAIVINNNGRLTVLRREETDTLPAAPAGRTWNPSVFFSPSGDNFALFSSDGKGDYALHVFQRNSDRVLTTAVPGGPSYGPVWANDRTIVFAAMRVGGQLTTYRADLR